MRKTYMTLIITLLVVLGLLLTPNVFANGVPYTTWTYNPSLDQIIRTQDAYLPLSIQYSLDTIELTNPTDITIDKDDNLYVSNWYEDSVSKQFKGQVIRYNLQTNETKIIGEDFLQQPTGVHIGMDGNLYVADFTRKEAYKYTYDSINDTYSLSVTYTKPVNTPYFSTTEVFQPSKIITDQGNVVYVLLAGNINGLGKFDNNGTFTGFFGGNQIPQTFENMMRSLFFNEEQRREWFKMIPNPVYNVAVDPNGLILTASKGQSGYLKLNIANNVYSESSWGFDNVEDLYVGPSETIFTITEHGYITEYAPDGNDLFIFSGPDRFKQKGLFEKPTGIAVDARNNIYVLDSGAKSLQVFIPTEFANLVHEAIELYQQGRYEEALVPWQKVLKMNALFDLANKGIADAYFAQGDYENALTYYEIARDREGYSEAFWEVRNKTLLSSGPAIIGVLLGVILLTIVNTFFKILKYITWPFRKLNESLNQFRIYRELKFGFYTLRHPEDGFYGIKREKKSSNLTALIYYLIFFIVYIIWIYQTNFQFNFFIPARINFMEQVMTIFVPILLWVVANYLVSSIRDGEGKLKDVFQGTAYTLIPLIITLPLLTLLSHVLTQNEVFIYDFIMMLGFILTGVYIIFMVKEIHFYDMSPTIGNIFITIFTAIMMLAFAAIVYMLFSEIVGLIDDIIREVTSRG